MAPSTGKTRNLSQNFNQKFLIEKETKKCLQKGENFSILKENETLECGIQVSLLYFFTCKHFLKNYNTKKHLLVRPVIQLGL